METTYKNENNGSVHQHSLLLAKRVFLFAFNPFSFFSCIMYYKKIGTEYWLFLVYLCISQQTFDLMNDSLCVCPHRVLQCAFLEKTQS